MIGRRTTCRISVVYTTAPSRVCLTPLMSQTRCGRSSPTLDSSSPPPAHRGYHHHFHINSACSVMSNVCRTEHRNTCIPVSDAATYQYLCSASRHHLTVPCYQQGTFGFALLVEHARKESKFFVPRSAAFLLEPLRNY